MFSGVTPGAVSRRVKSGQGKDYPPLPEARGVTPVESLRRTIRFSCRKRRARAPGDFSSALGMAMMKSCDPSAGRFRKMNSGFP
jgi:hypothetical protein